MTTTSRGMPYSQQRLSTGDKKQLLMKTFSSKTFTSRLVQEIHNFHFTPCAGDPQLSLHALCGRSTTFSLHTHTHTKNGHIQSRNSCRRTYEQTRMFTAGSCPGTRPSPFFPHRERDHDAMIPGKVLESSGRKQNKTKSLIAYTDRHTKLS